MSFFDQPYYAFTKAHMSLMGIWPEQSKYVRIIRLLTIYVIIMSAGGPMVAVVIRFIRLYDTRGDVHGFMQTVPYFLIGTGNFLSILRCIEHFDKTEVSQITLSFKNIEGHWEMFKNTSAVSVLKKYAERGRFIIVVYAMYTYMVMALYLALFLSPTILDLIDPLNETRPKITMLNAEYGVNVDKYYWFILAFEYTVSIVIVGMTIGMETMYILWTVHACALFEVVGFNLRLIAYKYPANKENRNTLHNDWNYKKICECITAHRVAISFADLIESICSGLSAIALCVTAIMIVFTGVQALINLKNPDVLVQLTTFTIAQVFTLFLNSIPGQELMNHSRQIHTIVYDLDWQDMSVKAQRLLILIMIRSNKPCCLTAEKVYVLSLESFGSTIRAVISYFTVCAQLIQ